MSNRLNDWLMPSACSHVAGLAVLCLGLSVSPAQAAISTSVVVLASDIEYGGDLPFTNIVSSPLLNDAGETAFYSRFVSLGEFQGGSFRSDPSGDGGVAFLPTGQSVSDGTGRISRGGVFNFNNVGQTAFERSILSFDDGTRLGTAIHRADGTLPGQVTLARSDMAAPGGGTFIDFGNVVINDGGQVAFFGVLGEGFGAAGDSFGIFRSDGTTGGLVNIARNGQVLPNRDGTFRSVRDKISINASGQVAFIGDIIDNQGNQFAGAGIYRGDGSRGGMTQIIGRGEASPDGNGILVGFNKESRLNDAGQIAFRAGIINTSGGADDDRGIFRTDGSSDGLVLLARKGQAAPDGNGTIVEFGFGPDDVVLNQAGQAAFVVTLDNTVMGEGDNTGIYLADAADIPLMAAVREGQAAPDGDGTFDDFRNSSFTVNDSGQVVFRADINGSSRNRGVFLYDKEVGYITIARKGDSFLGSTLSEVFFTPDGANQQGQVAYYFDLADGRSGIAIATIMATVLGDYNGNGIVDAADYTIWADSFGSMIALGADGNGNGVIDAADYTIWADNFGASIGVNNSLLAVPEPTTFMSVVCGSWLVASRRRLR